jgi:hypothetical protein
MGKFLIGTAIDVKAETKIHILLNLRPKLFILAPTVKTRDGQAYSNLPTGIRKKAITSRG